VTALALSWKAIRASVYPASTSGSLETWPKKATDIDADSLEGRVCKWAPFTMANSLPGSILQVPKKKATANSWANNSGGRDRHLKAIYRKMEMLRELPMICLQTSHQCAFILKDPTQTSFAGSPVG
jgi:hypothetical protein